MAISSVGSGTQSLSIPTAQQTKDDDEVSKLLKRFVKSSEKKGPARPHEPSPVSASDQADVVQLSAASSDPVAVVQPSVVEPPQDVEAAPEAPRAPARHKPQSEVADAGETGNGGAAAGGGGNVSDVTDPVADQTGEQVDPGSGTTSVEEPAVADKSVTSKDHDGHSGKAVITRVEVPTATPEVTESPSTVTTNDATSDLQLLNDRIDELSREVVKMTDSVVKFEELASRYEKVIANLTAGPQGLGSRFGFSDMSLRQINFALRFARRGFNILNLLQGTNSNRPADSLSSIAVPLHNGVRSLSRQTGLLLDSQPALSDVVSSKTGSLFSRTI